MWKIGFQIPDQTDQIFLCGWLQGVKRLNTNLSRQFFMHNTVAASRHQYIRRVISAQHSLTFCSVLFLDGAEWGPGLACETQPHLTYQVWVHVSNTWNIHVWTNCKQSLTVPWSIHERFSVMFIVFDVETVPSSPPCLPALGYSEMSYSFTCIIRTL